MAQSQGQVSLKRIGVDKTNSRIVVIMAVAAFLVVFFLVASYMLVTQMMYQNRIIGKKKEAVAQLEKNVKARDSLVTSYKGFVSAPQNLLGGDPNGLGPKDGSNAKLILDALPSKYDFPALTASLEKMANDQGVKIESITGTDDEVTQSSQSTVGTPQAVEMPFEIAVTGDYDHIKDMINAFELSIRPFQINTTKITGDQNNLTLTVNAKTYYQPEKTLNIKLETAK